MKKDKRFSLRLRTYYLLIIAIVVIISFGAVVGALTPILAQNNPMDTMRLDELVELMLDVVCSKRAAIRIAGENMPAEVVKSRFLKLNAEHIQYVLDCLKDNPPRIRNIKQYLLAALYNAPLTIENYYAAQIDHDLCGGKR